MKILNKIIEDISTGDDGKVTFDYEKGKKSNTAFGKSKMVKKLNQFKLEPFKAKIDDKTDVYSIYNKMDVPTITALKDKEGSIEKGNYTEEDYQHFVKRTANFINQISNYSKEGSYIVTPETTTPLLIDIVDEMNKKTSYDAEVSFDGFKKNPIDEIIIKKDLMREKMGDKAEALIKMLEKTLEKAKEEGKFKIKKVSPRYRPFLDNLFSIKDDELKEKLRGKNIIVLDDVLTSGTTLKSVYNVLTSLTSPEKIQPITLFKR